MFAAFASRFISEESPKCICSGGMLNSFQKGMSCNHEKKISDVQEMKGLDGKESFLLGSSQIFIFWYF